MNFNWAYLINTLYSKGIVEPCSLKGRKIADRNVTEPVAAKNFERAKRSPRFSFNSPVPIIKFPISSVAEKKP